MNIGFGLAIGSVRSISPYEPEALSLFARMSSPPSTDRAALINTLIKSLKTAGVWAKLDALYLLAAADAQAARLNWCGTSYDISAVNGPSFTADRGYTGNGSSAYLETGFNPNTASGAKYTRDSAHIAFWDRTDRAASSTSIEMGLFNGSSFQTHINARWTGNIGLSRINQAVTGQLGPSVASSAGCYILTRTGSATQTLYKNGASLASNTTASVALSLANDSFVLLAAKFVGSSPGSNTSDQLAYASIGGGLSNADQTALYSAINTYLVAIGAN